MGEQQHSQQRASGPDRVVSLPQEKPTRVGSVRQKGEKKPNRVSMLLERLTPKASSARSSSENSDDFVVSEPTQFLHRAHGETGLSTLLTPEEHGTNPPQLEKQPNQIAMRRAIALFSFSAEMENEISLEAGELVMCFVEQEDEEWWKGVNTKKQWGWFPKNILLLQ